MAPVRVVTDGDVYLPAAWTRDGEVTVVPLTVQVGNEVYQDLDGLRNEMLLDRMARERVRPMVTGPTVEEMERVYARLSRTTDAILSIHSSAPLSPIVENGRRAALSLLGRCDIMVMDSQCTSFGLGILVREAARMARAGHSLGQIVRHIRGMIPHIYVVMFTDSLDYLQRSGRISRSQCILGTMLGIRPFLSIEEGEIIPMEKVRSREKGIDKLVEFASEFLKIQEMAILQPVSYPTHETVVLQERLGAMLPQKDPLPVLVYGPVLASHVGPDGLGLIVYEGVAEE